MSDSHIQHSFKKTLLVIQSNFLSNHLYLILYLGQIYDSFHPKGSKIVKLFAWPLHLFIYFFGDYLYVLYSYC